MYQNINSVINSIALAHLQFCFSYHGDLPAELRTDTYVTMIDGYRPSERITLTLHPDEYPPSPNGWTRRCINMFEYFTVYSSFKDEGIEFATNQIFFPVHNADFWIDEVTVQQGENQSKQIHIQIYLYCLISFT